MNFGLSILVSLIAVSFAESICEEDVEYILGCPPGFIVSGLAARQPFFTGDSTIALCSPPKPELSLGENGEEYTFVSSDGGASLIIACPLKNQVITGIGLCMPNEEKLSAVTITCNEIQNGEMIGEIYEAECEEPYTKSECNYGDGIQRMEFSAIMDQMVKKVNSFCLSIGQK